MRIPPIPVDRSQAGCVTASAQHCPYCGEPIELLVEAVAGDQHYIEDCQVCCRPIQVHVQALVDGGGTDPPTVWLRSENEV